MAGSQIIIVVNIGTCGRDFGRGHDDGASSRNAPPARSIPPHARNLSLAPVVVVVGNLC